MNFIQNFSEQQFAQIKEEITQYFKGRKLIDHNGTMSNVIKSYDDLDIFFGLAYTSTGLYAGLFICNVQCKYNNDLSYEHFAINDNNEVILIVADSEEKEQFVNISEYLSKTPLQQSILRCKIEGNEVILPSRNEGELHNYKEVRQAFLNAGATYKENKFIFPNDAKPYIDRLMRGENVNIKKEFQFFGTPTKLANYLVELAEVDNYQRILEPSAGQGAIIKAIREKCCVNVDCCELMDINANILSKMEGCTLIAEDFLKLGRFGYYDRIIANPPFSKNQDIEHIYLMFKHLKSGGRIVTIASNSWRNGSQKKQLAFKQWLNDLNADIIEVKAGEFAESGTKIASCIIIINKP